MAKNKRVKIRVRKLKVWFNIPPYYEIEVLWPDYPKPLFAFIPESRAMRAIAMLLKVNAKYYR